MRNILILGGTGAMGHHLCQILAGKERVFVTTRKDYGNSNDITYIKGNAHDLFFLDTVLNLKEWDAIVDFMMYSTIEFSQRVDRLLAATNQYVFLSSSRVYADCAMPLTEESPRLLDNCQDEKYLATDEYALSKARQENMLRQNEKANWTIIRPYITFSECRLQLSQQEKETWLYRALHGRTIVFSRDLANASTTITYGADVAKDIANIIGQKESFGEVYHITSGETHTWNEILNCYLNVIERETKHKPRLLMETSWNNAHDGGKYQILYDRKYNRIFDNGKIQRISPQKHEPVLDQLDECLKSFLGHPVFKNINWGLQACQDRLTGEWAAINEINNAKQMLKYFLIRIGLMHYK